MGMSKVFRGNETDTVIVSTIHTIDSVLGPTGVGKSTFINAILNGEYRGDGTPPVLMEVGKSLKSCTKTVKEAVLPNGKVQNENNRILLIDTPGLNDTYEQDQVVVLRIAEWLKSSYDDPKSVIAGVVYLHDISEDRFNGAAKRSLEIFQSLCGAPAYNKVVIGTTKHNKTDQECVSTHTEELCAKEWKTMIEGGARVLKYASGDDYQSARVIVDHILDSFKVETILQIQQELAVQKKLFTQTTAGRICIQQRILEIANERASLGPGASNELKKKLEREEQNLLKQLQQKEAPDPFSRRILRIFGIKLG